MLKEGLDGYGWDLISSDGMTNRAPYGAKHPMIHCWKVHWNTWEYVCVNSVLWGANRVSVKGCQKHRKEDASYDYFHTAPPFKPTPGLYRIFLLVHFAKKCMFYASIRSKVMSNEAWVVVVLWPLPGPTSEPGRPHLGGAKYSHAQLAAAFYLLASQS